MTERDGRDYGMGSPSDEGEQSATPATWPRDQRDRAQPRSRLNQALSVARQHADPVEPSDPWHSPQQAAPAEPPVEDPVAVSNGDDEDSIDTFQRAFADILGEAAAPSALADIQIVEPEQHAAAASVGAEPPLAVEVETPAADVPAVEAPGVEQPAAEESAAAELTARPFVAEPSQVVVDLSDSAQEAERQLATTGATSHYGLGTSWGRSWRDSAQGWVSTPSGEPVWRPVVATTHELAMWDVDTYLGVVTAEVAVEAGTGDYRQMGVTLARGRQIGVEGLVEEAIERGAHAVIGVTMQYTPLGERLLLTMTGTAVTLQEKQR